MGAYGRLRLCFPMRGEVRLHVDVFHNERAEEGGLSAYGIYLPVVRHRGEDHLVPGSWRTCPSTTGFPLGTVPGKDLAVSDLVRAEIRLETPMQPV
jgi:hypothetical protein